MKINHPAGPDGIAGVTAAPPRRPNPTTAFKPGRPASASDLAAAMLAEPAPPRPKKRARPAPRVPAGKAEQAAARGDLEPLLPSPRPPQADSPRDSDEPELSESASSEPASTANGGASGSTAGTAPDQADGAFDQQVIEAELAALSSQRGIFELLLPDGKSIGVVVSSEASKVHFLLNPPAGALGERLRQHKMELEGCLQRRIRRNVEITVL